MGKQLNLSNRIIIESKLNENTSLRKIGEFINKPHTTISREIVTRRVLVKGNSFNNFNVHCEKLKKHLLFVMVVLIKINAKKINIFIMLKMLMITIEKL